MEQYVEINGIKFVEGDNLSIKIDNNIIEKGEITFQKRASDNTWGVYILSNSSRFDGDFPKNKRGWKYSFHIGKPLDSGLYKLNSFKFENASILYPEEPTALLYN